MRQARRGEVGNALKLGRSLRTVLAKRLRHIVRFIPVYKAKLEFRGEFYLQIKCSFWCSTATRRHFKTAQARRNLLKLQWLLALYSVYWDSKYGAEERT